MIKTKENQSKKVTNHTTNKAGEINHISTKKPLKITRKKRTFTNFYMPLSKVFEMSRLGVI